MRTKYTVILACFSAILLGLSAQATHTPRGSIAPLRIGSARGIGVSQGVPRAGHIPSIAEAPRPTVDGKDNPELIPDFVGFRHLIMAVIIPTSPSQDDVLRRDAYISRVRLSANDHEALVAALADVKPQLDDIDKRRKTLGHTSLADAARQTFKRQRDEVFQRAEARVMVALSADGRNQLQTFIQEHVKARIKMYGEMPQ